MRKNFLLLLVICFTTSVFSQKKLSRAEYISKYKNDAITEMKRSGVPASITLSQGILESGNGNSELASRSNNHFGIKCHSDWKGKKVYHDDDKKQECFRKYKTVLESYRDHSDFLRKKRYAALFQLKITDYKGWAKGLKKAGYATNPKYPELLIRIIEENNLQQYDSNKKVKTKKEKEKKVVKTKKKKPQKKQRSSKMRGNHKILIHDNRAKYIKVTAEDSFEKIAEEYNMGEWQLHKYNDWDKEKDLFENGILFLQPKKSKSKTAEHTAISSDTYWKISQQYGIKLKKLLQYNNASKEEEIKTGDTIYLQRKK